MGNERDVGVCCVVVRWGGEVEEVEKLVYIALHTRRCYSSRQVIAQKYVIIVPALNID